MNISLDEYLGKKSFYYGGFEVAACSHDFEITINKITSKWLPEKQPFVNDLYVVSTIMGYCSINRDPIEPKDGDFFNGVVSVITDEYGVRNIKKCLAMDSEMRIALEHNLFIALMAEDGAILTHSMD